MQNAVHDVVSKHSPDLCVRRVEHVPSDHGAQRRNENKTNHLHTVLVDQLVILSYHGIQHDSNQVRNCHLGEQRRKDAYRTYQQARSLAPQVRP